MTNKIDAIMADVEDSQFYRRLSPEAEEPRYGFVVTMDAVREALEKHLQPESEDEWGEWIEWGKDYLPIMEGRTHVEVDVQGTKHLTGLEMRIIRYRVKKTD